MTCSYQLPSDILVPIFDLLIPTSCAEPKDWKNALQLISASSHWREAGLPMVYKNAYLWDIKAPLNNVDPIYCNSNLQLIADIGHSGHIKTFNVVITNTNAAELLVRNFESILTAASCDLENVSTLCISSLHNIGNLSRRFSKLTVDLDSLATSFIQHMPNIVNFDINYNGLCEIVKPVITKYAICNHSQIHSIKSNTTLKFPKYCHFENLSHLSTVVQYGHVRSIPQDCAESLTSLTLTTNSLDILWSQFATGKADSDIVFPRLQKLSLTYNCEEEFAHIPSHPTLHFPQLHTFRLSFESLNLTSPCIDFGCFDMKNTMYLEVCINIEYLMDENNLFWDMQSDRKMFSKKIRECMPNITRLELNYTSDYNECYYWLFDDLFNVYACQLKQFAAADRLEHLELDCALNLTSLDMNVEGIEMELLPRLNPSILEYINLSGVSDKFSLNLIGSFEPHTNIIFDNLEYMQVRYRSYYLLSDSIDPTNDIESANGAPSIVTCPKLKHLYIINTTVPFLRNLLCTGVGIWPNVQCLEIKMQHCKGLVDSYKKDSDIPTCIDKLAKQIYTNLPKVVYLTLDCSYNKIVSKNLYSKLIDLYSHQLQRLHCGTPVYLNPENYFANIKHMNLFMDSNTSTPFPRINPRCIEQLKIKKYVDAFDWNIFASNDGSNIVSFDCLEVLVLRSFQNGSSSSKSKKSNKNKNNILKPRIQLSMPNLRTMTIDEGTHYSNIWNVDFVNIGNIESLDISNTYSSLMPISLVLIEKAKSVNISITDKKIGAGDRFYELANKLFNSPKHKSLKSKLNIYSKLNMFDCSNVAWNNLTSLEINNRVTIDVICELLPRVPCLVHLVLLSATSGKFAFDSVVSPNPLSTSLVVLEIMEIDKKEEIDDLHRWMEYLILGSICLKAVRAYRYEFDKFGFAKCYKNTHPHIAGIEFKTNWP